jgi:hypothetical protein
MLIRLGRCQNKTHANKHCRHLKGLPHEMDLAFDDIPYKLFQQHWRRLKGSYDLNFAFENADRLPTSTKAYRQSVSLYYATDIIKPTCVGIYRKKYF